VLADGQKEAWDWVEYLAKIVLSFLVGVTTVDSVKKLKVLSWAIVICHGYLAFEFNLSYFAGQNRLWSEGFGGMDNNCMVIALVTSLGLAFFLGMETRSWFLKGVAFGSCAFMGHAVLFSFSRGGMLATAVVGMTAFFLMPKRAPHYLAFALAAAAAIYLAGPQVRERLFTSLDAAQRDSSAQTRLVMWRDTLDCFAKNPVFGIGPRNWPLVAEQVYGHLGAVKEAHTLWLQTLAQIGLPGFLFLVGFYGLCIGKLLPLARGKEPVFDPWLADAARMVIAALVGFVFAAQFVSIEPLEVPFFINLVGFGILRVVSFPPVESPRDDAAPTDEAAESIHRVAGAA
jgi:O-antigen ligase